MATTAWIKRMLDRRGIPYEELHHRVAFSTQEVAQAEHTSGHRVVKVVVAYADDRPVELILPASRRVVLNRVQELLGAEKVRLATEAEMDRIFTDCETGAIPPLRHWKDVAVLMDASMPSTGDLVFQAGTHEDAIRLQSQYWLELVKPLVGSFSAPEHGVRAHEFTDRWDSVSPDWEGPAAPAAEEARRQSGLPGGGKGRIEIVERSGVYPGSGPYPEGEAELRTPAQFVRGQVDEQGREVEGGAGLIYAEGALLGDEPPSSGVPPVGPK